MVVDLNEIEIRKWATNQGDILVIRNTEVDIDTEQAAEIKRAVIRSLGLPPDSRIMVFGRDWDVSVVREDDAAKS